MAAKEIVFGPSARDKLLHGVDTLADAGRFGPWFLRIVTNVSLNFRRARGKRARHYSLEDCTLDGNGGRGRSPAEARHLDERPGAELAAAETGKGPRSPASFTMACTGRRTQARDGKRFSMAMRARSPSILAISR